MLDEGFSHSASTSASSGVSAGAMGEDPRGAANDIDDGNVGNTGPGTAGQASVNAENAAAAGGQVTAEVLEREKERERERRREKRKRDGALRFMVVIGNL